MELLNILVEFFQTYGYFAVFSVLLLCGFGLPVPKDVTLVAGGVISYLGNSNEHIMFGVGMAGVMLGDSVMFLAGYYGGERILSIKFIANFLTPKRYEKVQEQFEKHGKWVVFFARFMPGLRAPIFLSAGISKRVSFRRFFFTDGLAALISVPVWIYLGFYGATNFEWLMSMVHKGQALVLGIVALALIILGFFIYRKRQKE